MPKALTFSLAMAVAATIGLSGPLQAAPDADTVVARVNGEEITLGHMILARATLPQQYQQLPPDVLYTAILDQLVQQTALKQAQEKTDPPVPHHVELSLENEKRQLLAAEEIERILTNAATDEAIRAEYDQLYADGYGGDEFSAAHILVETEDEAKAVKAEVDRGADFAEVAKTKSTGPSGPNGGDLGWFSAGDMVPAFEAAVMEMEPGQVSDPVQTQFGWHIIKLNEKRKAAAPSFDEAREQIAQDLRRKAIEQRVEELTAAATVERPEVDGLDPSVLTNIELLRN